MHTSLGHSLSTFIVFHLLAWHTHQIPTPTNLMKPTFQPGTSMSACFQKLVCPSIGTLNHIPSTIHIMRTLGIQICDRYLKQDSQLLRGNRIKTFFFFFWSSSVSSKRTCGCRKSWVDQYKYFHIHIIYRKNFSACEILITLYREKGRQAWPSTRCLSFPFQQKAIVFEPMGHGFPEHGLHS